MGMDLMPLKPSKNAPRDAEGHIIWGRYNIMGWKYLRDLLELWMVDTSELSNYNDGEIISKKTCLAIADAIENNLDMLPAADREWLGSHIILWRTCGGYQQW